jgi:hypothetical protein
MINLSTFTHFAPGPGCPHMRSALSMRVSLYKGSCSGPSFPFPQFLFPGPDRPGACNSGASCHLQLPSWRDLANIISGFLPFAGSRSSSRELYLETSRRIDRSVVFFIAHQLLNLQLLPRFLGGILIHVVECSHLQTRLFNRDQSREVSLADGRQS